MTYVCIFVFKGEIYATYNNDGIFALKNGFWVDENLCFTYGKDDAKYWIPPHKINYIEKYEERK